MVSTQAIYSVSACLRCTEREMVLTHQRAGYPSILPQANVLVIGPSSSAHELLRTILMRRGHAVDLVASDITAVESIERYDLLVLELDPRDAGAVEQCADVRVLTRTPLLVLVPETARNQGVQALELGADMFITVPFDRRELVARVEALVRRDRGQWLPVQAG